MVVDGSYFGKYSAFFKSALSSSSAEREALVLNNNRKENAS